MLYYAHTAYSLFISIVFPILVVHQKKIMFIINKYNNNRDVLSNEKEKDRAYICINEFLL